MTQTHAADSGCPPSTVQERVATKNANVAGRGRRASAVAEARHAGNIVEARPRGKRSQTT
jgi:hypothetical protein